MEGRIQGWNLNPLTCMSPIRGRRRVLSQTSILGVKSENQVSEIQGLPDTKTLGKAHLYQNLLGYVILDLSR
jgi:hypothetical protein